MSEEYNLQTSTIINDLQARLDKAEADSQAHYEMHADLHDKYLELQAERDALQDRLKNVHRVKEVHRCTTGFWRPYPQVLCSTCGHLNDERDRFASEELDALQAVVDKQIKALKAAKQTIDSVESIMVQLDNEGCIKFTPVPDDERVSTMLGVVIAEASKQDEKEAE